MLVKSNDKINHDVPYEDLSDELPLVVDIDGSLINTDLLYEALIGLIKYNPIYIFNGIYWLLKGKAFFKISIFERVNIQYENLPYNQDLLLFLKNEYIHGRKIFLATASPVFAAKEIAKIQTIFLDVFGTEFNINLKGRRKAQLLENKFGKGRFDYVGNSKSDLVVFASSRFAYLVNPNRSLENKTRKVSILKYSWKASNNHVRDYIKAIRVYQWIKNLLIFVPLFTSHSFKSIQLFTLDIYAIGAFNLVASAGYLFNDLLDLNSDRKHPRKRDRPIASGKIPITNAFFLAILFLGTGLYISASINYIYLNIIILYFILSFTYSLFLKRIVLYDVFILAMLYSIRVFSGAAVISVILSFWLIAFSTFIFLSLALLKRFSELIQIEDEINLKNRGRGYTIEDINLLQIMGIVSGFLSVVVFSLYINSPEVSQLYTNPKYLWSISFLFLFWISRMWLFTTRRKMTDDPIIFALKDLTSYLIFLIIAIVLFLSV